MSYKNGGISSNSMIQGKIRQLEGRSEQGQLGENQGSFSPDKKSIRKFMTFNSFSVLKN